MSNLVTIYRRRYDPTAFIQIDLDLLVEFGGDYETCSLFAYLQFLLTTEGAKDNGGWVILSYDDIEEYLFMKRTAVDRAIKNLEQVGLKVELKPSRFHSGAPVRHFRFDNDVLEGALNHIATVYNERKNKRHEEFRQRRVIRKGAFAEKRQKPFVENQQVLEDVSFNRSKKSIATPSNEGLRGASKDSNSKAKAPRPVHSNNTNGNIPAPPPPNMHNRSQTETAPLPTNEYQFVFREVRRVFFGLADNVGADDKTTGKVKRLAGYLWSESQRPANETLEDKRAGLIADIPAFSKWWKRQYKDASLPLSPESLSAHWARFISTHPAHTPPTSYVIQEWGGNAVKTDVTNSPATGGGGGKMELDKNIFGFLFGKREDNES